MKLTNAFIILPTVLLLATPALAAKQTVAHPVARAFMADNLHPIAAEIDTKGGVLDGTSTEYYANGQPREVVHSVRGQLDGHMTSWWENGKIYREGAYRAGHRDGAWHYYYASGKPMAQIFYKAQQPTGRWTAWWETGRIMQQGAFKNGLHEGTWTTYYADGHPRSVQHYMAGLEHGRQVVYHNGGVKPAYPEHAVGTLRSSDPLVLMSAEFDAGIMPDPMTRKAPVGIKL